MMKPKRVVSVRGLPVHIDKLSFGSNFPWESLLGFPRETIEELNWRDLTKKAPFQFIRKTKAKLPWDWEALTLSHNIRWEYLVIHTMPWVYRSLHLREDFSFEFYANNITNYPWDHNAISKLSDFPLSLVARHPKLDWCWHSVCRREGYTLEFANSHSLPMILKSSGVRFNAEHLRNYPDIQWDFNELAKATNEEFYRETQNDHRWTRSALSHVKWNVFNLIEDNVGWNFKQLSKNPHLRVGHLRMPGDWDLALASKTVPLGDILENTDIEWNYGAVSSRTDMSTEIVERYSHLAWPWESLAKRQWFSASLAIALPDKPWDFKRVLDRVPKSELASTIDALGDRLCGVSMYDFTSSVFVNTIKKNPQLMWDWKYISRSFPITSIDLPLLPKLINELLVENPFYMDFTEELVESMSDL